ncbi:MAG: hypothetical protein U7M05_11655 [Candidatus Igneacidithiobacillus chanchocoensis]
MLIGVAGYRRSGKDTAGLALWVAGFCKVAFADAVRKEAFAAHPEASMVPKDEPLDSLGGRSPRDLLLEVGARRRAEDPLYWVKIAREKITSLLEEGKDVVVTDVRLPEEVDALRSLGARLIWVERPGVVSNGDVTEQDISLLCDETLLNAGQEIDLQRQVISLLGGKRCGNCRHFNADRMVPRYGFCKKAPDQEKAARLHTIASHCSWNERFSLLDQDHVERVAA